MKNMYLHQIYTKFLKAKTNDKNKRKFTQFTGALILRIPATGSPVVFSYM